MYKVTSIGQNLMNLSGKIHKQYRKPVTNTHYILTIFLK